MPHYRGQVFLKDPNILRKIIFAIIANVPPINARMAVCVASVHEGNASLKFVDKIIIESLFSSKINIFLKFINIVLLGRFYFAL